jgi:hypothetical protein
MQSWQRFALVHAGRFWLVVVLAWATAIAGDFLHWWRFRFAPSAFVASLLMLALVALWANWQRERVVREAPIPQFLQRKLREAYPHLTAKDTALVERGLRQFFLACLRSHKKFVAMPSRAVDAMWHEFILHTKAYRDWCELSLGYFLHHTPAEALSGKAKSNDGLRRAWYWACRDEAIKPGNASRLPLLFALDAKLEIANGFRYAADCSQFKTQDAQGNVTHCGGDFSIDSFSGDADGFGGMDSSDAGGDGGGGDGCGGGGE